MHISIKTLRLPTRKVGARRGRNGEKRCWGADWVIDLDIKGFLARQGKPGASSGCNSRPGKGNEPPHLDRALDLREVTTWVKRRQSDVRAVTQVKRLSLVIRKTGRPTRSKT